MKIKNKNLIRLLKLINKASVVNATYDYVLRWDGKKSHFYVYNYKKAYHSLAVNNIKSVIAPS